METAPGQDFGSGVALDYRILFDAVPGLYLVLDTGLAILAVNDAYARATMIDRAAVIGQPLFQIFPDNPDDPAADGVSNLRASLNRVLAFKRPDVMAVQKYDIRMPDGAFAERYWSPLNLPVLDARGEITCIIHRVEDVTDQVRLRSANVTRDQLAHDQSQVIDELRAANRKLAHALSENERLKSDRLYLADLVNTSNDAIVARTPDGKIASWNRAAEIIYGYSAEEVLGKAVAELAPQMLFHDADGIAAKLDRGEPVVQYETIRRRKDGTEFPVSISASLIRNAAGDITGSSAIVRDITERRQAEERMRGLQAELVHLSRWNTMGMMASTLAHELNQPLTATINYIRAGRRTLAGNAEPDMARALGFLDSAVEEAKLAGGVIRSLRDFIEKREISRKIENINSVVEEAVTLSLLGSSGVGVKAAIELDALLPPVLVDKIQIEQVLLNLIRNAIEAMAWAPDGQLTIMTGADEPGFVGVVVSDTGPGLATDIAEKLFQPFVTTKDKGMGIGLTICQSIIEGHGGKIWATPVSPHGVSFRFRLPVAELS